MSKHVDGIDNVFINFDDNDGCYEAGQVLTGKVVVLVHDTTSVGGIKLYLTGSMKIKWMEMDSGSLIPYEEHEAILNDVVNVFKPNPRDVYSKWLFPGRHVYPFSYSLPIALPYSLDGSKYGRIEYKSKAEVLLPNTKPSESLEEEFFVQCRPDKKTEKLLEYQGSKLPRSNVEYGSLGGGCFAKTSRAEIFLNLPASVYRQGDTIELHVEITVEQGKCGVEGLMVLLVQEMIYTCNLDEEDEMSKKEVLVVGEHVVEDKVDPGEKKEFPELRVPVERTLPVTGFPHCDHIDVGYFVHAVAKVGSESH